MRKRILFIEDDLPAIEIYGEALKKEGFEIEILTLGKQGLERLKEIKEEKKAKPDLILLDLILPDISGMEVLKEAKRNAILKSIPFFILTNYSDPKLEKEIWKLGPEKYIVKANYTPSELIKIIKDWFKNR